MPNASRIPRPVAESVVSPVRATRTIAADEAHSAFLRVREFARTFDVAMNQLGTAGPVYLH